MTWSSRTSADAFTEGMPSIVTSPPEINVAACVRDRARPRAASAESSRDSGVRIPALKSMLKLVMQLRERGGAGVERLILDETKS